MTSNQQRYNLPSIYGLPEILPNPPPSFPSSLPYDLCQFAASGQLRDWNKAKPVNRKN